ncbi:lipoprotein, partial [Mesoplasma whartonense]|uniref:lipoprotein n=1 Tax=Mesoplasma whartonense TaxID=2878854 RepID=UPI0020229D47
MKKFLSILAAVGLASTAAISVVACENNKIIQAETVNKTADDLVLAPDHQSATLKLNQVEALKLELVVQESENKYVNGINLPASDQAVVVNGTNIIATFTPNFESGIVMVVLKADKAITVPEVTFVFGDGNAKLSIANLNLDFISRQIIRKSAILG